MGRLLWTYILAIIRHGWWLAFALVGIVGDAATVYGNFSIPRPVWYVLIAFGILAAQFKAYQDVMVELAATRARLRELDTPAAKRAYIDEQLERAQQLRGDIESIPEDIKPEYPYGWQDVPRVTTIISDLDHWENSVRATLREWFSRDTALLFADDSGTYTTEQIELAAERGWTIGEAANPFRSKANSLASVDARITRLREIRETI